MRPSTGPFAPNLHTSLVFSGIIGGAMFVLSGCAGTNRERVGYDPHGDVRLAVTATQIAVVDGRPATDEPARTLPDVGPDQTLKTLPALSREARDRMVSEVKRRCTGRGPAVSLVLDLTNAEETFRQSHEGLRGSATATVRVTVSDALTGKQRSRQTSAPTGAQGLTTTVGEAESVFQDALLAALRDGLRRVRDAKDAKPDAPGATFQSFPGTRLQTSP